VDAFDLAAKVGTGCGGFVVALWGFTKAIRKVRNGERIKEERLKAAMLSDLKDHQERILELERDRERDIRFRRKTLDWQRRIERRLSLDSEEE
jgi:hypothetical protein